MSAKAIHRLLLLLPVFSSFHGPFRILVCFVKSCASVSASASLFRRLPHLGFSARSVPFAAMVRARLASGLARAARAATSAPRQALFSDGRAALAASVCRGNGAAAAAIAGRASAGTNGGYSRWFPAAAFLPAAVYMAQDPTVEAAELERTFIAIKPDGVQRGLISEIVGRFERKGYKLVAIKLIVPTKEFAAQHYDDLSSRPFFNGLCDFLSSGPVVAMVWEGQGVIKYGRKLIGATSPQASEPGTIRGDLCVQVSRNIIHGSDGPETAVNEIGLWFKPEELVSYTKNDEKWLYE